MSTTSKTETMNDPVSSNEVKDNGWKATS